ncbi:hypothetical protein K7432_001646 [Basidiobolus ranarum]|uniref:Chromatin target of PRMT1 protein C-terminal domain-containing protein n=1 Tax=Basidiobolus ranarum TaxID=34480 RepID=A0ABR2W9I4_9FUNG
MRGHPNNRKGNVNTVNRRVVATANTPASSGTSLSDRFSKIAEARKMEKIGTSNGPSFNVKLSGRVGTPVTATGHQNIQQRLGNTKKPTGGILSRVGGGVTKKAAPAPKGRANPNGGITVRGAAGNQTQPRGNGRGGRSGRGGRGSHRGGRGGRANGKSGPKSKDDLDKELDSFMMKDDKTAKTRLDDELEAYMTTREANNESQSMETDS